MHQNLLTSRVFSVERRVHHSPAGDPITRDVVVHPGAVVILPVLANGHIVMIRNHRYTVEEELWELPAGTRESGEEPEVTARRELEEETGFRAEVMTPVLGFFTSPGICTEWMHAFVATKLEMVGQKLQGDERIHVEVLPPDDVRRMLIEGRWRDAKTLAVLGHYFLTNPAGADG